MNSLTRSILVLTVLLLIAACSPPPKPLPTVAVLPTSTETNTPSKTPTRTATATATATRTPTATFTPTSTITSTPTKAATATSTFTLTATDTPTTTDTPEPTDTPTTTPSRTPTSTRTPTPAPSILAFSVSPQTATAGTPVTVTWHADADKVIIEEFGAANELIEKRDGPAQGTMTFTAVQSSGNVIVFRLTAVKAKVTAFSVLTVPVTCPNAWFMSPAPPGPCPQPQQAGAFTYQTFQNGVAIYVSNNNTVYFMTVQNNTVMGIPNNWNQSIILPTVIPPSPYVDTNGPIGYVWRNQTWADGRTVQTVMGYATAPSVNYNGIIQFGGASDLYIKGYTGQVFRLLMGGQFGSWAIIS